MNGSARKKKPTSGGPVAISEDPTSAKQSSVLLPTGSEPVWKLRVITTDTSNVVVAKDTEKEDRFRAFKESWETMQPGRSVRARDAREAYIKLIESGGIKPHVFGISGKEVCKAWSIVDGAPEKILESTPSRPSTSVSSGSRSVRSGGMSRPSTNGSLRSSLLRGQATSEAGDAPELYGSELAVAQTQSIITKWPDEGGPIVLNADDVQAIREERVFAQSEQASMQEEIRRRREEDRETRASIKLHQATVLEVKHKEMDGYFKADLERREGYKQAIIRHIDDTVQKRLQAIEAARLAEESLGEEAAAPASSEKRKGKSVKK